MKTAGIKNIIVQAGGLGSRLESLTRNRPKCLVPIDNIPIIFHLFKKFPKSTFTIIADYKADILEKYLSIFAEVKYRIVIADKKGTSSGIKTAISDLKDEPFMIIWSDLLLGESFKIPETNGNYIGISNTFECRWSFKNNECIKEPSIKNGIAGLFIFKSPNEIKNIPNEGGFVNWLKSENIKFTRLELSDTKEIGTLLAYELSESEKQKCRPFNRIKFFDDHVIKYPITKQGEEIAKFERNWYKTISKYKYKHMPKIYQYEPLKIERIFGKNIFEYNNFTQTQRVKILEKIIESIKELHELETPNKANTQDCYENYFSKTFDRIEKVKKLIPFSDNEHITINNKEYKNVFFVKELLEKKIKQICPAYFKIIHGDPTFSNIMLNESNIEPMLIDPRGYFGKTKIFGDEDYDWAKLYYSIVGNYDQFNQRNFSLEISDTSVNLDIMSNNWEDVENDFFKITDSNKEKIMLLHALIWLSLTTYAWEDYDSICGAFYKGIIELNKVI